MARRPLLVAVVVVTAVALAIPAGAAIRPFAPQQTLVGGCPATFDADAVTTASGAVVGFATCPLPQGDVIRFFSRNANGTVNPSEPSGFSGIVLGVARDGTATYVLYFDGLDIRIGKRTNAGAYSSRVVDPGAGTGGIFPSGDVIARDGQWFGVWSKQVGPGEFAQTELFSGGSVVPVRRVTTTAGNVDDYGPTLAYSGSMPVLIWSRIVTVQEVPSADLYVSKYISGTWQATRAFATAGQSNLAPDMHIAGGLTFVAWHRDGFNWVASNPTGSFSSHMFNTGGLRPFVGASTTGGVVDHIFVSWTSFTGDRVFFAESATSGSVHMTWDGAHVGPAGSDAFAVRGFGTKATVVYGTGSSVASRTQS
jgi:hypothetical protein